MKIINILIASIALVLFGYYIGYTKNCKKSVVEKKASVMISKKQDEKAKEVLLKQEINNESPIEFKIKIIAASSVGGEKVDKDLKEIKKMLGSIAEFSKFTLLEEKNFKTKIGETKKILLPNNEFIYFTPRGIEKDNSLSLNIRIPWVLNVNLHTKSNEGFFQGGLKKGDDFIILYIESVF